MDWLCYSDLDAKHRRRVKLMYMERNKEVTHYLLFHSLLQEFDLFSQDFSPKNGLICSNL